MSRVPRTVAAVAVGYLFGTFPTADLVARRASRGPVDLRNEGTGNPGTANAFNVLGAGAAAQVLVGDIGKGALASAAGAMLAGPAGAHVAGTSAVIGHCYPVWSRFRGGKGVATSVGQCVATFPAYFPIDVVVAVATVANPRWKRRAFATTVVSSTCWVAGGVVWWRRRLGNPWGPTPTAMLPVASAISSAVIITRFASAGGSTDDPTIDPTGDTSTGNAA